MNPDDVIVARLVMYAEVQRQRDKWVRDAYALGLAKTEIHELSGIARTTIDRILEVTE